jgi:23S rRNA (adenine2030-N6)-methyltransferase
MNYKHIFHAGGFADVFKHCVEIALIEMFFNKATPIAIFDLHAGKGLYDLSSVNANKTREYHSGISKIYQAKNIPLVVEKYLNIIRHYNSSTEDLRFYPGSPAIAERLLRPNDRLILVDLNQTEYAALKNLFHKNQQVNIHQQDAYQALMALTPPKEKRGLVMIDPPYEQQDEVQHLTTAMKNALKKWSNGVYAIWYPIKNLLEKNLLISKLEKLSDP